MNKNRFSAVSAFHWSVVLTHCLQVIVGDLRQKQNDFGSAPSALREKIYGATLTSQICLSFVHSDHNSLCHNIHWFRQLCTLFLNPRVNILLSSLRRPPALTASLLGEPLVRHVSSVHYRRYNRPRTKQLTRSTSGSRVTSGPIEIIEQYNQPIQPKVSRNAGSRL